MPEESPMFILLLLLLHVPPALGLVIVVVAPMHTVEAPEMADGSGLTVTGVVTLQPVESV
jgi:hypothetical protein